MNDDIIPKVEVAVTIIAIARTDRMLAVYNPRWGAFSLPMTKRRRWEDPNLEKTPKQEDWRAAATREAAEKLGRTFRQAEGPVRLLDEAEYKQSDVDGIWKRYAFSVFGLAVADGTAWAPNVIAEWHTREEFATLAPISHTALYVLACLEREGLLPPW